MKKILVFVLTIPFFLTACSGREEKAPLVSGIQENQWNGMSCYEYGSLRRLALEKNIGIPELLKQAKTLALRDQKPNASSGEEIGIREERTKIERRLMTTFQQMNHQLENEMLRCVYLNTKMQ